MKILIAPNAFKGTLTAAEAAAAIARGLRQSLGSRVTLIPFPIADGGDGFAEVLASGLRRRWVSRRALNPIGTPLTAQFALTPDRTAIIEMARASGIALLARRNPLHASTFGTGQLIRAALDLGAKRILLGIGGSASTDAGTGIARALGVRFLDRHQKEVSQGGIGLERIHHIDISRLDRRLAKVPIQIACDVQNPLYGPRGAAHIFAPQKGATHAQVRLLDRGLKHLAQIIQHDLHNDVRSLPGGGAAGGTGAGLTAFLNATLHNGFDLVADFLHLNRALKSADLVITGEGRLDASSSGGKAPHALLQRARALHIPTIALAGQLGPGASALGFNSLFAASEPTSKTPTPQLAASLLTLTAQEIGHYLASEGYLTK